MILENEEQAKIKRVLNSAPDKIVLSNLCDKTYIYIRRQSFQRLR